MKVFNKVIKFLILTITLVSLSCEDNESGIDSVGLEARFVSEIETNTVVFTNISNDATTYLWDFGDQTTSQETNPTHVYEAIGNYTVTLTASDESDTSAVFSATVVISELPFDGGIIVNGDFENGAAPWIQGVNDNNPAPVVTVDGNTYYSANVTSPNPSAPFLVNVSQKLEIIQGETYTLSFDAWSDVDRSIIAGIGLSGGNFANNSTTVNITTTPTNYELVLEAAGFGASDARVLFDLNAEAGIVNIDNVILTLN